MLNMIFFGRNVMEEKSRVASFGADSVLPEYRGNALNSVMVNYRLKIG